MVVGCFSASLLCEWHWDGWAFEIGTIGNDDNLALASKRSKGLCAGLQIPFCGRLHPRQPRLEEFGVVETTRNALLAMPLVTNIKVVFNPSHVRDLLLCDAESLSMVMRI